MAYSQIDWNDEIVTEYIRRYRIYSSENDRLGFTRVSIAARFVIDKYGRNNYWLVHERAKKTITEKEEDSNVLLFA